MAKTSWRVLSVLVLCPLAVTVTAVSAPPAAAVPASAWPVPAPVRGTLLPIPTAGQSVSTSVADITASGVVGGTITSTVQAPDGSQSYTTAGQRWLRTPGGWRRQQLAQPAGTRSSSVGGLTDSGEAAGLLADAEGRSRAVRWSLDGRSTVVLGQSDSNVTAVGPDGPWGVHTTEPGAIPGSSELVDRDGRRTPLTGTRELDAGYDRTVLSLAGPRTALIGVRDGVGRGAFVTPVIYRDGATLALPVVFSFMGGTTCLSPVQPDGSMVYSGIRVVAGVPQSVFVRHVGGVPGHDVPIADVGTIGSPSATLGCEQNGVFDRLAADGGVAGMVPVPTGTSWVNQAAYWDDSGVRTLVPLGPGEQSSVAVAVATRGRIIVRAETASGSTLSLWQRGVRTPLILPPGWTGSAIVEFTDTGLLVGTAGDAAGRTRPVVWDLSGR